MLKFDIRHVSRLTSRCRDIAGFPRETKACLKWDQNLTALWDLESLLRVNVTHLVRWLLSLGDKGEKGEKRRGVCRRTR